MGLLAVVHLWKLVPLPTASNSTWVVFGTLPGSVGRTTAQHWQHRSHSDEASVLLGWACYQNAWYTTAKAHTLWPVARWWSLTAHTGASYCITRTCWNVISKHVTVYYSIWDITYQPSMPGSRPLWSQSCPAACWRSTVQNLWFKNWAVCPREESQEDGLTLTTSVRVDRSLHYMGNPI